MIYGRKTKKKKIKKKNSNCEREKVRRTRAKLHHGSNYSRRAARTIYTNTPPTSYAVRGLAVTDIHWFILAACG